MKTLLEAMHNLKEAASNKILLQAYYRDKDIDPVDITDMHGILYGGFNDENLFCYETGYSSIKELEKAIKSKKYMIDDFVDSFEEDDELINLDGEGRWKWLINYIEDSSVDGDSADSLFLIDSNGYKILYCGSDSPSIEKVSTKKSKMILKTYQPNDDGPVIPYFKYGKYELNCSPSENNIEVSSSYFDKIFYDEFWDESYTLEEIEDKLNVNLLSLITDEQKIKFLELCKERKEYEEIEEDKAKKKREEEMIILQKKFSKETGEEIKLELVEEICENNSKLGSFDNLQPELLHLLNKCDIKNSHNDGMFYLEYILKYFTKGKKAYQNFMDKYELIDNFTSKNENLTFRKLENILEGVSGEAFGENNLDSEEQIRIYSNPKLTSYQVEEVIEVMDEYQVPPERIEKYINIKLDKDEFYLALLGLRKGLTDKQNKELIKFIKEHKTKLNKNQLENYVYYYKNNILNYVFPALKKNVTSKQLIDILNKSKNFSSFLDKVEKI